MIERYFFSLTEAAKKLQCKPEDLLKLGSKNTVKLHVNVPPGMLVAELERNVIEGNDRFFSEVDLKVYQTNPDKVGFVDRTRYIDTLILSRKDCSDILGRGEIGQSVFSEAGKFSQNSIDSIFPNNEPDSELPASEANSLSRVFTLFLSDC